MASIVYNIHTLDTYIGCMIPDISPSLSLGHDIP